MSREDSYLPLRPPPEYEEVYRLLTEGAGKLAEAQAWLWERQRRTPNLDRIVTELETMKRAIREQWGRPPPPR